MSRVRNKNVYEKTLFKFYLPSTFATSDKIEDIEGLLRDFPGKLFFCKKPKQKSDEFNNYQFDVGIADLATNDEKDTHYDEKKDSDTGSEVGIEADDDDEDEEDPTVYSQIINEDVAMAEDLNKENSKNSANLTKKMKIKK